VPPDPFGQRGLAPQAVHLLPARYPRLDAVAVAVADDVLPEELDELGSLRARAHEAHLAAQDVQQLRQLVERGAAQEAPDRGTTVLALDAARGGVAAEQEVQRVDLVVGIVRRRGQLPHRAELEEVEDLAVA